MNTLSEYLHAKHWEYCELQRRNVPENEWVRHLNKSLPSGEKFSIGSVNQWMNEDRGPDGRNMARLITAFGLEVLPYLNVELDPDLLKFVSRWPDMPQEARDAALRLSIESDKGELATLQT